MTITSATAAAPVSGSLYALSHPHKCLLRAALMQDSQALNNWQQWRNQVDIETLDSDSYHLLSALYPKLLQHRIEDPHMGRLKGVYRRTWYANQLLIQQFKAVLQAFQAVQIDSLVLGEMALAATCHPDYGYRPIYRFDLLVPVDQTLAAIAAIDQLGWIRYGAEPTVGERLYSPIEFHNGCHFQLRLHNHLFEAVPQAYTDQQLWINAIAISIGGISTLAISPVDQLLHLCLQINREQKRRPIYGLADATAIANAIQSEAEWVRLVTQAQRYEIILPLRYLLIELQALLPASLPDWVIPSLRKLAISYSELLNHKLLSDNKPLLLKAQIVQLRQQWLTRFASRQVRA